MNTIQSMLCLFQGHSLRAQLLRGGMGSISIKIINTLLVFLLSVLLARLLGPEGYGVYAFTLSILMLVSIPIQAGLPTLVVRETAKAFGNKDWPLVFGVSRWAVRLIYVFSLFLFAIIAVILWAGQGWIGPPYEDVFLAGMFFIPLVAMIMTQSAAVRGLGRVCLGQLSDSVLRPVFFLILLLATLWLAPSIVFKPHQAMQLQIISTFIALCISTGVLWRLRAKEQKDINVVRQESAAWFRAVFPLMLVAGFQLINAYADIILLGLIRTDEEVGVYRVAVQMGNLVMFGLVAVNQVLHPHFAELYSNGDKERLQRLVTSSAKIIFGFAIPPALLFVFAGEVILKVFFGEEYMSGSVALGILTIGQLANAAFGSVGALLNMTGHEKDTVRGMMIAAVVNILLNIFLIPMFGISGAASATAISYFVWNAVLRYYVRKRLGIESFGWGSTN